MLVEFPQEWHWLTLYGTPLIENLWLTEPPVVGLCEAAQVDGRQAFGSKRHSVREAHGTNDPFGELQPDLTKWS